MDNGNALIANIGSLILDFIVGLIKGLLQPLLEGIFGTPPAAA